MKTSKELILIVFGSIGMALLILAGLLLFMYILFSAPPSSSYEPSSVAFEENSAELEAYYEDFERLNNFIIKDYDTRYRLTGNSDYQYYYVNIDKGNIDVSNVRDSDEVTAKKLSLEINSDLKKSVKRLKGYISDFNTVHATENQIDYNFGDVLVYTRDGSIPTYTNEVEEDDIGYLIYKFKDNWFYFFAP